jgi:hypothetical protein
MSLVNIILVKIVSLKKENGVLRESMCRTKMSSCSIRIESQDKRRAAHKCSRKRMQESRPIHKLYSQIIPASLLWRTLSLPMQPTRCARFATRIRKKPPTKIKLNFLHRMANSTSRQELPGYMCPHCGLLMIVLVMAGIEGTFLLCFCRVRPLFFGVGGSAPYLI